MSTLTFPILWKDAHERGIKGVIELSMSDLPLKGARVRDLFPVLNTKINAKFPFERNSREVETFLLYGTRVSRDRSLKALIPELRSCPRFVVSMRLYPNWAPRSSIRIFIKTLTDRIILINCETTDTVVCLKSRIRDKEGIAPDVQSLVFAGKELENHLSLRTYGIKNLSQVHLVRLMRGGGGPPRMFADWRIVRRGLNIEGRCKNVECAAYQHMVIHPKQYEAFNLMRDDDIRCPICHSKVKPRTCGFYDCVWKFDGTQEQNGFSIISQWKEAFGRNLMIVARRRDESTEVMLSPSAQATGISRSDKCSICWSKFGLTASGFVVTISCGHSFHCSCIDKWSGWCMNNGTLPSCPVCRREVQTPAYA
ncbi:ubiquitin family RING domain-containing protein [Phytophthora infestans T30-4]|uniref:Ubiquitin family RING domain-containing protein n=1 Tax=Phytophthora infestans (strain T30-4) TaxID=403677 RepID=D0NAT9_PHYIT|nr:ubiquitin family RING domain-containing protein [Phytophthora infestans T30-4]EEY54947.1 ubiquitin family RING domain-containing protein [Phytophthora infestans T30-4]|eukprot:XP_002903892.1 ubiquitin family RING domain-containing protein [Phytophthora infestans T30-4]